jgi:hypothetical protein
MNGRSSFKISPEAAAVIGISNRNTGAPGLNTRKARKICADGSGLSVMLACVLSVLAGAAARGEAQELSTVSSYDLLIGPLLLKHCAECHGEQKQKAKLALHSWEGLARGSDAGPVVVAGKPAESALLERMQLPLSDEEHMPPEEKQQPSPEEIALLSHWIAAGASRTTKLAELSLPDSLAKFARRLAEELAAPLQGKSSIETVAKHDPIVVAQARAPWAAKVGELQQRYPGALVYESRTSTALNFNAAGLGKSFGDRDLEALLGVAEKITRMDISLTSVTDQGAPVLARLVNLRELRMVNTNVGDATIALLLPLQSLERISLFGTKVTAASLPVVKQFPALKSFRLGNTPAEPTERSQLPPNTDAAKSPP